MVSIILLINIQFYIHLLLRPLYAADYSVESCPKWLTTYQHFHRRNKHTAPRGYLIGQCDGRRSFQCGGISDRFRTLPFLVRLAERLGRIFLYRWIGFVKDDALVDYFAPNQIDWTVPANFSYANRKEIEIRKSDGDHDFAFLNSTECLPSSTVVIVQTNRMFPNGMVSEEHCVLRSLFRPNRRIDALVRDEQEAMGVTAN
jgi:hypothetical protein